MPPGHEELRLPDGTVHLQTQERRCVKRWRGRTRPKSANEVACGRSRGRTEKGWNVRTRARAKRSHGRTRRSKWRNPRVQESTRRRCMRRSSRQTSTLTDRRMPVPNENGIRIHPRLCSVRGMATECECRHLHHQPQPNVGEAHDGCASDRGH